MSRSLSFSWRAGFRSLRVRLILTYWLLSVLPIGMLGWFMLHALNQFYLARLQDDMSAEADLMADAIADDLQNNQPIAADRLIHNPPPPLRSQARVLVFDASGDLVAASGSREIGLQEEPGLGQALTGTAVRGLEHSPALNVPVAFVAQPVVAGNQVVGVIHLAYAMTDIQKELAGLQDLILVAMALIALLALMVSLEFSRRLTRPLDELRSVTYQVAAGRFDKRVSENGPTEVSAVAHSFNRMTEALQQAEQARQTMFANLAHDVRTPLGSLRAAAEALHMGAAEQPALRERLTSGLIQQTAYLRRLTDDLLRLATYESGGLVLKRGPVELPDVLAQAAEAFEATAQGKGVRIRVELSDSLPTVRADSDRILEALLNLLDNALQYTPSGGCIQLAAELDKARRNISVHVRDDGPGISPQLLPNLFDRYRRGEARRSGSGLNMGLGLSIAQAIVTAHGGAIAAANRDQGGADFFFSLPLQPADLS